MRLLEARYHPEGRRNEFVVVGLVWCGQRYASLVPREESIATPLLPVLLANLKYLILISAPRPFETLRALDSTFWSFAEVGTRLVDVLRANDT